jgi:hypothetical protein
MSNLYQGCSVALLTQHGKEKLIAPILEPSLGCRIVHVTSYDTDQLGTFTGEIKRIENQINTARKKAKIGMSLNSSKIGIASEGAFVADPFSGLMPWNVEVVLWTDDENKYEVIGIAQGAARNLQRAITSIAELEKFASEAGFPDHHLVLRKTEDDDKNMHKGIGNWSDLRKIYSDFQRVSSQPCIYAESDLRAFCNPTRQRLIELATKNLLDKLTSLCPICAAPGFWISKNEMGLPCRACKTPTKLPLSYLWTCAACNHKLSKPSERIFADPSQCDFCNP